MSNTVTFDEAPPPGTINLGIGQPSADLLPVDLLKQASDGFFENAQAIELNYGVMAGDQRFLDTLARFLSKHYQTSVEAKSLFVSGGTSQALDFVTQVFTQPGDTVFVEEPSYFLAFQIFKDHGLNIVGIPIDHEGMNLDALQVALKIHRPKFVYTIPSYHNPGGHCLNADRRKRLVELSQKNDFLIVADEAYQLLNFYSAPPPAFGTMIESGTVLSLGSFSKILAPAMRLGWIQCASSLKKQLLASGIVNSGGSLNHYSSHMARLFIDLGLQDRHLAFVKNKLKTRSETMNASLEHHFSDLAQWTQPQGGYFYWLVFDKSIDTAALKNPALKNQSGFQPGVVFSSCDGLKNCLRLSFSHYSEQDIAEGIARLRALF